MCVQWPVVICNIYLNRMPRLQPGGKQILWGQPGRKDDDQETNQAKGDRAPGLLETAEGPQVPPAISFLPFPTSRLLFGLGS